MEYEIKFHPMALQEFCGLDGSIKKLVKKQLEKLKVSPFLGEELGNKNQAGRYGSLQNCRRTSLKI